MRNRAVDTLRAMRLTAGAATVALAALLIAHLARAGPAQRFPLPTPRKLTVGPLLGVVPGPTGSSPTRLTAIDPRTLRPWTGRSLVLPFLDAWAVGAGGHTLALAVHAHPQNEPNSLELVRLPGLHRERLPIRFGGDVSALAWTSSHTVVAVVGRTICCGDTRLRAVAVDLRKRRIAWTSRIPGTVLHLGRMRHGLVLLTAPSGSIGHASLALVGTRGVTIVRLRSAPAGLVPGESGITHWYEPGLAVDRSGGRAFVVEPNGLTTEIDLTTLNVSAHRVSIRRSLLDRLAGWLEPTAAAKGDSGPIRRAQWLGDGYLLVTGDPAGIELVDTRTWTEQMLAPEAGLYEIGPGVLLATGSQLRYGRKPHGIGLVAYAPDGTRRFQLFAGRQVWVDRVVGGRAFVGGSGWNRDRIVALHSGRVLGTTTEDGEGPLLLLGPGELDDY